MQKQPGLDFKKEKTMLQKNGLHEKGGVAQKDGGGMMNPNKKMMGGGMMGYSMGGEVLAKADEN